MDNFDDVLTRIFGELELYTCRRQMYNAFGSSYAFFANQGVNFLYVLYGGAILQQKMLCTDEITPEMPDFSTDDVF